MAPSKSPGQRARPWGKGVNLGCSDCRCQKWGYKEPLSFFPEEFPPPESYRNYVLISPMPASRTAGCWPVPQASQPRINTRISWKKLVIVAWPESGCGPGSACSVSDDSTTTCPCHFDESPAVRISQSWVGELAVTRPRVAAESEAARAFP